MILLLGGGDVGPRAGDLCRRHVFRDQRKQIALQAGDPGALLHQGCKRAAFLLGWKADVAAGQEIRQRARLRALEQIEGLGMVALLEQDLDRPIIEVQLVGEIAAAAGVVLQLAAVRFEQIESAAIGRERGPEVALHVIAAARP